MNDVDEKDNRIRVQVNILNFGSGKHFIETVKLSGDRSQFNDNCKELKSFFGGHVNSVQ